MEKFGNNIEREINHESVREKILGLQFQYIKNIEDGKVKKIGEKQPNSVKEMIFKYTELYDYIYSELEKRGDFSAEELVKFRESVIDEISNLYKNNSNNLINDTRDIINRKLDELGPIDPDKIWHGKNKNEAGVLKYDVNELRRSRNIDSEKLKKFGFSPFDASMEIHLDSLFDQKHKDDSVVNIFSKDSLAKTAEIIIEKYSEVRLLLANSWLVDNNAIRERIGFVAYDQVDCPVNNPGFWGQFIDQNGNINEKRAKTFLDTGVPEFYLTKGFIKTEDFLKKYLPEDKRGIIDLKELNPEYDKNFNEMVDTIFNRWNECTISDIDNFFNTNKYFREFVDKKYGQEFVEYIKEAKEKNIIPRELDKNRFSQINYNLNEFFKDKKFIDKKITL